MLSSLDKAIVGTRDHDTVDFDVFDHRKRALQYKLEDLSKSGLMIPPFCEDRHSSLLQ